MASSYGPDIVLPGFEAIPFDPVQARRELDEFADLLARQATLSERRDVLPFFRARPQLSLFLGSYAVNLDGYDRLAYEYGLFGHFAADVVVGDWVRRAYCFIEFEDAQEDSVFTTTRRHTREWGARFEHGFGQIVDWFWLLEAQRDTETFERKFGARRIDATALLITGRSAFIQPDDWPRLRWRTGNVLVGAHPVICRTYDEVLEGLRRKLDRGLHLR